MYVKLKQGQPHIFPYDVEQLREDNPNTSFPKHIPSELLKRYGVFPVATLPKPDFDPLTEMLVRDELPYREVIRLKTEADVTNPITGNVDESQIGQPIYGNRWLVGYTVQQLPEDEASANIRSERNRRLASTDWMALKDVNMSQPWADYRQALRNLPQQAGFPYSVKWPPKPE